MGRPKSGWKLRVRKGVYYVRFTHDQREHEISTRERSASKASRAAEAIYARVIGGEPRPRRTAAVKAVESESTADEWIADLGTTHDKTTVRSYEQYSAHWVVIWPLLSDMTARSVAEHIRERLGKVQATTVRKEASALRSFFAWCVERGHMREAPAVMSIPKRATGKVVRPHRQHPDLPLEAIEAVLAELPVRAARKHRKIKTYAAVRAWFRVLWETSLRPSTLLELEAPTHYRKGATDLILASGADKARFARPVPLTDAARKALDEVTPDVGRIFPAKPGRDELRRAAERAGLPADVVAALVPYSLRHGRITRLLESGASIIGVQYLAGHKHLTTTAKYVRSAHRHAVDALAKAQPIVSGQAPETGENGAKK